MANEIKATVGEYEPPNILHVVDVDGNNLIWGHEDIDVFGISMDLLVNGDWAEAETHYGGILMRFSVVEAPDWPENGDGNTRQICTEFIARLTDAITNDNPWVTL